MLQTEHEREEIMEEQKKNPAQGLSESEQVQVRRQKLADLQAAGSDPFALTKFPQDAYSADLKEEFKDLPNETDSGKLVALAGRMMSKRVMGKASFCHVQDLQGNIQIYVARDMIGEEAYADFKKFDIGDIIGVKGEVFVTKTGETSIRASEVVLLSKSLQILPEKYHGLTNVDLRYRQRYTDLIMNPDVKDTFIKRSKMISCIRRYLDAQGFIEVETPMLVANAGGAAARPFETHYNALDEDVRLRISLELYLKRLIVGGFDKVYEVGRIFRNEGMDTRHNPEFTMLEAYCACGDFETMANMVEELICHLAEKFCGGLQIDHKDAEGNVLYTIDLSRPWKRADYQDLIRGVAGEDWFDISPEARRARCEELGVEISPDMKDVDVSQQVYEKLVEEKTMNPCFVTHVAKDLVPLAKLNRENPDVVDVYELVINGQEISPGYSELNDPDVQKERLEHQAAGETQRVDYDFIETLEYGMPSAGGIGIGIDRVVMMLTGASSIRDVLLFPQLKRKDS